MDWVDDFTALIGSGIRGYGDALGGVITAMPGAVVDGLNATVDYVSNMTVDDWLDAGQLVLDVVGMVPVLGEVADVANGAISLARGNYADAALSFAAAVPFAGNVVAATKIGKKVISKVDDVVAGVKYVKCKVTGKGCFVAGTEVWVVASAERSRFEFDADRGSIAITMPPTITKTAIESVAIGSRLAGENPQTWEYDDSLPEPVQADWSLVTFSMTRKRPAAPLACSHGTAGRLGASWLQN